jgi:putative ABC transport system permease protein
VNDPLAVLVAQRFAQRHGLARGSTLRMLTADGPKDFHVRGVVDDSGPAASFGGQVVVMFLDAAQIAAVLDRRREIGALRAIGATERQVAAAIVVEAGFLGFCAVVAGVGLGLMESGLFLRTLVLHDTGWHVDFVFPWASTVRIAALAILASMFAGGVAALSAARSDVAGSVVYE